MSEGCEPASLGVGTAGAPIVNGVDEDGYPAVGGLVIQLPGEDHSRSFCTGTLIDPSWVLTAAHCVDDLAPRVPASVEPSPTNYLHFYVGPDSETTEGGLTFAARRVVSHPNYLAPGGDRPNDVALIELEAPVTGVTPIPIRRDRLAGREGAPLVYVGFGATRSNGNGSGRKRSTTLRLEVILPASYITEQVGGGVCFGDSGGPGFLDVGGGQLEVIGVNSTVSGNPPCEGYSTQTRVDAHQTWIDRVMGTDPRGCLDDIDRCQCAAACGADGVCDDAQCGIQACTGISLCLRFCSDQLCQLSCFLNAAPEPRYLYETLSQCIARECPNRDAPCISLRCRRELLGCDSNLDNVTGAESCSDVYRCSQGCAVEDLDCLDACFYEGSLPEQGLWDRVEDCTEARCSALTGDAKALCVAGGCRDQLLGCMPDEACALTGGDCPDGRACRPEAWVARYCLDSGGATVGSNCTLGATDCEDGALCVAGTCREVCADANDCEVSFGPCVPARAEDLPFSIGVCSLDCPDADADGACDDVDCDPWDATRFPGAEELCDDPGVDEDCDGERNENCIVEVPDAGVVPDAQTVDADARDGGALGTDLDPGPDGCRCAADPTAPWPWSALGLIAGALGRRRRRGVTGPPGVRG